MASLPIADPTTPSTAVRSMKTKDERETLLSDLEAALAPYAPSIEVTPYSNRHFVAVFATDAISAMVDFDGLDSEPSMIHWHKAHANLKAVSGAFDECDINEVHRRKATSFPATFPDLVEALIAGFAAAANGSAFQ